MVNIIGSVKNVKMGENVKMTKKEIFNKSIKINEEGKRIAKVFKENGDKYKIILRIKHKENELEEKKNLSTKDKEGAIQIAEEFLNKDRDDYFWKHSIKEFLMNILFD